MKYQTAVAAFVVILGTGLTAHAQVDLKWKFKQDARFWIKETSTLKQTMTFGGARNSSDSTLTIVHGFTVKKVDGDVAVLEQKIDSVELKNSADPKGLDVLPEILKGSTFTLTLNPVGRIVKYEGYDELYKKFGKVNETTAKMLKATITEDSLKQGLIQQFSFLADPKKPDQAVRTVKKGDDWSREVSMPLGPIGTITAKNTYTYAGKGAEGDDRNLEKFTVQPKLSYAPPPKALESPFPFKVVAGEMEAEEGSGTIYFDAALGRVVRSEMNMTVKINIKVDVSGKEAAIDLVQDQKITTQVLDKAPEKQP